MDTYDEQEKKKLRGDSESEKFYEHFENYSSPYVLERYQRWLNNDQSQEESDDENFIGMFKAYLRKQERHLKVKYL